MNDSCNHSNGTERAPHLIQVKPVPDNTDSEADRKESSELHEPGHSGPQLSADDGHHDQNTQPDLEPKQKELRSIYLV